MKNQNCILLAMQAAKNAAENVETIEEKLRVAMKVTSTHFLLRDDDDKFRAAVAAIMDSYDENSKEYIRLNQEVKNLRRWATFINAAEAGLTVDIESIFSESQEDIKAIGLMKIWEEISEQV